MSESLAKRIVAALMRGGWMLGKPGSQQEAEDTVEEQLGGTSDSLARRIVKALEVQAWLQPEAESIVSDQLREARPKLWALLSWDSTAERGGPFCVACGGSERGHSQDCGVKALLSLLGEEPKP